MKFYFCEGCGVRVTEKDIEAQRAKNKQLKGVYCLNCAVGVTTVDTLPMSDDAAKALLANEAKSDDAERPSGKRLRSTSSARTNAVSGLKRRPASLDSSRTMRAAARTEPKPKSNSMLWIGAGVGLALIACVALVVSSGGNGRARKPKTRKTAARSTRPAKKTPDRPSPRQSDVPKTPERRESPQEFKRSDPEEPAGTETAVEEPDTPNDPPLSESPPGPSQTSPDKKADAEENKTSTATPVTPEQKENTPANKPVDENEAKPASRVATLLAKAKLRAQRRPAYKKLMQADTAEARSILTGLKASNQDNEELQAELANDLAIVGMVDEILGAVPKGIADLKDGRAFTFHDTSGRKTDVGKGSSNTVKGLKDNRILVSMDLGGGTAEVPIDLSRLNLRTHIELGRMGLGVKAHSLHEVLAQWLSAQESQKAADLAAIRAGLKSEKVDPDQKPLAKHLLDVIEGMSREVMAKRALEVVKEACAARSWKDAQSLLKSFLKKYGDTAMATQNKDELRAIERKVLSNLLSPDLVKVLEGIRKPSKISRLIQRVAPGFMLNASGRDVFFRENHKGLPAVRTHPVDRGTPSILKGVFQIPGAGQTSLQISVSNHGTADWRLIVRVNGQVKSESIVNGKRNFNINLSDYAGTTVLLELENHANDWRNEYGFWHKVEVVSK